MRKEGTTRAILVVSTVVIVVVVGFSAYPLLARRASAQAEATRATQQTLSSITLPVWGMDCAICAVPIKGRLHELAGVGKVDVDVPNGRVSVNYDPGKVKPEQLVTAISSTGYKATLPKE
jgi:copper chaperone CopZ